MEETVLVPGMCFTQKKVLSSSKNLKYSQAFYLKNLYIPIKRTQPKNSTDSKHFCPIGVI
jgi:hypothetical protein